MKEDQKKVMEGEIVKKVETEFNEKAAKKKRVLMLFIVGILVGLFLKGIVLKPYVIGFEDYKLKNYKSDFNLKEKAEEIIDSEKDTGSQATDNDNDNDNTEAIDPAAAPNYEE